MANKLIYNRFVKDDLKEINEWYKEINKELWNSFTKEFRLRINLIKENPLSFELKYNNIRIVFLKKFPYGIHYSYNAEENVIEIYSVFHTSRDPEIWKGGK
ncbi:type II toxin-antitoxin system RelE/ParE family toxin [Chryseobacterium hispalense]|uniref:type II toxin-antitoxin system RelE/ParE family toxin n=1 Tax=Chryseobacterium hispalense TaxID=1453492 RepID=UPI0004939599|nr:type II toxin-antitoxin system RelE/ParE family toxin [Chryseobacterium hispalense]